MSKILKVAISVLLGFYAIFSFASANTELREQILQQDSKLFGAFNSCDIELMSTMFSRDLEFYHDVAGLGNYESNMQSFTDLCARNIGLIRTLIHEETKVYPVKDFGAMQVGKHTFCHFENGKEDCGTFSFSHVWKKTESAWVLHRVLSYDH